MKIIDENGAAIENPDLTLGYLVDDTEPVEHPAVEGVEEVSHYETVTEYPGGGRDVRKVIDVPGVRGPVFACLVRMISQLGRLNCLLLRAATGNCMELEPDYSLRRRCAPSLTTRASIPAGSYSL